MVKFETIPGIKWGDGIGREWVLKCLKTDKGHVCSALVDADHPKVIENGIDIYTRKGVYGFDLIQLKNGTKLLV